MSYTTTSEQLFDRWHSLSLGIATLASIVQNDPPIHNATVIEEWETNACVMKKTLSKLVEETLRHLAQHQGEIL